MFLFILDNYLITVTELLLQVLLHRLYLIMQNNIIDENSIKKACATIHKGAAYKMTNSSFSNDLF